MRSMPHVSNRFWNIGSLFRQKFATQAAKDRFISDLHTVIYTNKKVDHFVEIYVPPELGGERVLETFIFMSKKRGKNVKILCSYFANVDQMDEVSRWLPQNHNEHDIRKYLSWKLYTQLTREVGSMIR